MTEMRVNPNETLPILQEGVSIGSLSSPKAVFPALIDLFDTKGVCFLYGCAENKREVNNCLERIAWRMTLSLPIDLCELLVYNGGKPGENFVSLNRLPKSFFKSSQAVLFDADSEEFTKNLSAIYRELATRPNAIKASDKNGIFEMNESEVADAELKYAFLFVSDFPHVTEEQRKLISKIVSAGCHNLGVFVFVSWDMNAKLDDKIDYQSFLNEMTLLFPKNNRYFFKNSGHDELLNKFMLCLDGKAVNKEESDSWLSTISQRIEKASSVSSDIRSTALTASTLWSKTSKFGLEIPIGNVSSKELMSLELCPPRDSTIVHGLIGGTSGSGKSTLLHDIIINGAWLYSPDELQFILLDFKSVEFGIYSGLPHVRVMSTKSDREYGSNVLAYITEEIEYRKKLFGKASSIEEYNDDSHHVPRLLVIIDEFHNLFVNEGSLGDLRDSNISDQINKNFNKILKEGRAFGVHLLLATQEAGGIQSIDAYLQQIKLRIVLKMEVKGKFLSYDNPARPDQLKRGEGIYNDDFGKDGSNHPFRFTFYGHEKQTHKQVIEKEMIVSIRKKSVEVYGTYSPCEKCFYRGGGESTIHDNADVVTHIDDEKCVIYVGSPVTVRCEDVFFELMRKRGSNMLIVGANSDYLESLIRLTFIQTIKQSNPKSVFILCQSSNDDFDMIGNTNSQMESFKDNDGLVSALQKLNAHLEARQKGLESPSDRIVFALLGLRFFDVITQKAEVKNQLESLIIKGSEVGIHTLLHSVRFADFEKAFKQAFGMAPSISPDDMMREFDIKIELKGEDGHYLLPNRDVFASPKKEYFANIQIKDGGEITKFSIYQN